MEEVFLLERNKNKKSMNINKIIHSYTGGVIIHDIMLRERGMWCNIHMASINGLCPPHMY